MLNTEMFSVFIIECVYSDRLITFAMQVHSTVIQAANGNCSPQSWLNQFKTHHEVILVWFIKSHMLDLKAVKRFLSFDVIVILWPKLRSYFGSSIFTSSSSCKMCHSYLTFNLCFGWGINNFCHPIYGGGIKQLTRKCLGTPLAFLEFKTNLIAKK